MWPFKKFKPPGMKAQDDSWKTCVGLLRECERPSTSIEDIHNDVRKNMDMMPQVGTMAYYYWARLVEFESELLSHDLKTALRKRDGKK